MESKGAQGRAKQAVNNTLLCFCFKGPNEKKERKETVLLSGLLLTLLLPFPDDGFVRGVGEEEEKRGLGQRSLSLPG